MNRWLELAGLFTGALVAVVLPASAFLPLERVVWPLTIITAAAALCLFLRLLLTRAYRDRIDAINIELRDGQPFSYEYRARKALLDPEWGLFGSRTGNRVAQVLRLTLFVEAGVTVLLTRAEEPFVSLVMAGFFAVMTASMLQMATSSGQPSSHP